MIYDNCRYGQEASPFQLAASCKEGMMKNFVELNRVKCILNPLDAVALREGDKNDRVAGYSMSVSAISAGGGVVAAEEFLRPFRQGEGGGPSPSVLFPGLQGAFSYRPYFPPDFGWRCACFAYGFPGCEDTEHFLARVFLAVVSWHQVADSHDRGVVNHTSSGGKLLRVIRLRNSHLLEMGHALDKALRLLFDNGARIPVLPEKKT